MYLCVYVHMCGDQSLVFSFTIWILGLELTVMLSSKHTYFLNHLAHHLILMFKVLQGVSVHKMAYIAVGLICPPKFIS